MYTGRNFEEKDELAAALEAGKKITIFRPTQWREFISKPTTNGIVSIEGPHRVPWEKGFTEHEWFGKAWIKNGIIVRVE